MEKEMATHSSVLAWRIPWTEELGVGHDWSDLACIRVGNGNPLQYSCLENPRDRGAWWAVHRVRHDWSDSAAAAAATPHIKYESWKCVGCSVCLNLCNPWIVAHQAPLFIVFPRKKILKWVAIPFARRSSQPMVQTQISCNAGKFFTFWATRKVHKKNICTLTNICIYIYINMLYLYILYGFYW